MRNTKYTRKVSPVNLRHSFDSTSFKSVNPVLEIAFWHLCLVVRETRAESKGWLPAPGRKSAGSSLCRLVSLFERPATVPHLRKPLSSSVCSPLSYSVLLLEETSDPSPRTRQYYGELTCSEAWPTCQLPFLLVPPTSHQSQLADFLRSPAKWNYPCPVYSGERKIWETSKFPFFLGEKLRLRGIN